MIQVVIKIIILIHQIIYMDHIMANKKIQIQDKNKDHNKVKEL